MAIAHSLNFGAALAGALGLDTKNLAGFDLKVRAGEVVLCDAMYLVPADCVDDVVAITKSYTLQERS